MLSQHALPTYSGGLNRDIREGIKTDFFLFVSAVCSFFMTFTSSPSSHVSSSLLHLFSVFSLLSLGALIPRGSFFVFLLAMHCAALVPSVQEKRHAISFRCIPHSKRWMQTECCPSFSFSTRVNILRFLLLAVGLPLLLVFFSSRLRKKTLESKERRKIEPGQDFDSTANAQTAIANKDVYIELKHETSK